MNFLILYFCNLVLDYPLQDDFLKKYKSKNSYILFVHCLIWGLGISIALWYLGLFAWWKVMMLVFGHYIIDYWKCRGIYKKWPRKRYYIDKYKGEGDEEDRYEEYLEAADVYIYSKPVISDWVSLYIDQTLHLGQILLCLV